MNIKNENKPVGGDEGDNASGSGGPGWPEACRREETIRKLLGRSEGERLKMGDVEEVALELGVSRAMLYRLITAYRQTPTVEALEPRPRFARANQRRELGRQRRVGHLEDRIGIASEFFDDPRDRPRRRRHEPFFKGLGRCEERRGHRQSASEGRTYSTRLPHCDDAALTDPELAPSRTVVKALS